MDASARKAERLTKRLGKLEDQLFKEKQRTQKYKDKIAEARSKKASRRSPGVLKVKRTQTVWVRALQQWNQGKDLYRIPKKGTPEYDEVVAIKQKLGNVTEPCEREDGEVSESSPKRPKTHQEIRDDLDNYPPPSTLEEDMEKPTAEDLFLPPMSE